MNTVSTRLASLAPEQRRLVMERLNSRRQASGIRPRTDRRTPAPLSSSQKQFWFLQQLNPKSVQYNLPSAAKIDGPVDAAALEQCLSEIVRRHESLRTTFTEIDGEPVQVVQPPRPFHLAVSDAPNQAAAEARVLAHARTVFDLRQGPLFQAELVRTGPTGHVLLMNAHHIISDNWSAGVLVRELVALYQSVSGGRSPASPLLPIQYADFASWQQQPEQQRTFDAQLEFWRRQLSGSLPVLQMPADHPRPANPSWRGALEKRPLPAALAKQLRDLSAQEGVTLFMALLSGFKALLMHDTGQQDIIVGTPVSGRDRTETHDLIGCFVNTIPLRTDCSGEPSFLDLLRRVRSTSLDAFSHQNVPFPRIVEVVAPARDAGRTPIFQVAFGLRQDPVRRNRIGDASFEMIETHTGMAKFDLMLEVVDNGANLTAVLEYNSELFEPETMQRLLARYQNLLSAVTAAPERPLIEISLATQEELDRIAGWNSTTKRYPLRRCLHQLIEDQVDRTPHATAVRFRGAELSYRELDERANQLARRLQSLGVERNSLVGVSMERSLELVVSLVAILKAGGAYVPIDPEYPADRIAYMLSDANPPVLLTQQRLLKSLPAHDGVVLTVDTAGGEIATLPTDRLDTEKSSEEIAYAIYTSGSTGRPKGAMNSHRGIVNRLCWMQDEYRLGPQDRVLQKTPFSFDVSVWEFFWPLMTGATLVVAKPGGHRDSAYLADLIEREHITTLHFVPSMLQLFLEEPGLERLGEVRRVICSGEALPVELERRFFERMSAELHNLYGPTEAAVDVTYWQCDPRNKLSTVPIGRPIANTKIHLLDSHMNPVPIGVAGELFIGGSNVGMGYLNRPGLTAEKFVRDPFRKSTKARLYRTGDLARYLPDGSIEYLGRLDHQVKIRGFRIELGEIESVLNQHDSVRESVVSAVKHPSGDTRLAAYLTPAAGRRISPADLREHLKAQLPEYMTPAAFVALDALPLSPNGKVDRKALPEPKFVSTRERVAPRNDAERELVAIWERVLHTSPIGVKDNFFEIGGHSLAALRVVAELEKSFAVRLPVATLFQRPTVEQLADVVRAQSETLWSASVTIQEGDGCEPLFFVPGGAGNMAYLTELAPLLGRDQAVIGMRYRGVDGEAPADTDVDVIASRMTAEIERVQPDGSYHIAGHCFGGVVAFAIARRLQEKGKTVAFLGMVNTPAPFGPAPVEGPAGLARWILTIARAWEEVAGAAVPLSPDALAGLSDDEQLEALRRAMVTAKLLPPEAGVAYIRGLVNVFRANSLACYRPEGSYPLPITLLRAGEYHQMFDFAAAEDPGVPTAQSTLGWRRLSTLPVAVRTVPGNHLTMLNQPNVQKLAEILRDQLQARSSAA